MQIINLTLMNMNHIIKLLFLCLFFATACSQEEMNEVLKNHAEMEGAGKLYRGVVQKYE